MSSKLLGAFRETLKDVEEQSLVKPTKDKTTSDRPPCRQQSDAESAMQADHHSVKRRKKPRRYHLAPN